MPLASDTPIAHDCSINQASEIEAKMQAPDAAAGGQEPKGTILVVEDDPDIVEILRLYLESSGYRFLSAGDGKHGLDVLHESDASLALVDLMMPSMNGFDFIKEARAFTDIPIIIVSARNQPSDKVLGLDLGADGYVTKPFDPTEVLAYVRAFVFGFAVPPLVRRPRMATAPESAPHVSVNPPMPPPKPSATRNSVSSSRSVRSLRAQTTLWAQL